MGENAERAFPLARKQALESNLVYVGSKRRVGQKREGEAKVLLKKKKVESFTPKYAGGTDRYTKKTTDTELKKRVPLAKGKGDHWKRSEAKIQARRNEDGGVSKN